MKTPMHISRYKAVRRAVRGFTLIEVMIVVAIVAILAAVAYPSYMESVARGKRADAKGALLKNVQWIERQYSFSNAYNLLSDRNTALNKNVLPALTEPKVSGAKGYTFAFTGTHDATRFTLAATPDNASDKCGTLTLAHTGERGLIIGGTASSDQTLIASCWDR